MRIILRLLFVLISFFLSAQGAAKGAERVFCGYSAADFYEKFEILGLKKIEKCAKTGDNFSLSFLQSLFILGYENEYKEYFINIPGKGTKDTDLKSFFIRSIKSDGHYSYEVDKFKYLMSAADKGSVVAKINLSYGLIGKKGFGKIIRERSSVFGEGYEMAVSLVNDFSVDGCPSHERLSRVLGDYKSLRFTAEYYFYLFFLKGSGCSQDSYSGLGNPDLGYFIITPILYYGANGKRYFFESGGAVSLFQRDVDGNEKAAIIKFRNELKNTSYERRSGFVWCDKKIEKDNLALCYKTSYFDHFYCASIADFGVDYDIYNSRVYSYCREFFVKRWNFF